MHSPALLTSLRLLLIVAFIAGPVSYAYLKQQRIRNFRIVREGVLYRSGQNQLVGLQRIVHDYGIRTVITLRDASTPGQPPPDLAEEVFCQQNGIRHVRITPRSWEADSGPAPVEMGVRAFLEVMDDPKNYPVLLHCFAGVHRTGAYCALYRMEYDNWTLQQAMEEMKACGYDNLDRERDIRSFLESYQPGKLRTRSEKMTRAPEAR